MSPAVESRRRLTSRSWLAESFECGAVYCVDIMQDLLRIFFQGSAPLTYVIARALSASSSVGRAVEFLYNNDCKPKRLRSYARLSSYGDLW